MNKLYSLLTAAVICSAASGLVASEGRRSNFFYDPKVDSLKSFFDQKTQDAVKKTAKNYTFGYVGIYSISTIGAVYLDGSVASMRECAPLDLVRVLRPITRSIPVTLPLVVGSTLAYHKYQENLREKNAA